MSDQGRGDAIGGRVATCGGRPLRDRDGRRPRRRLARAPPPEQVAEAAVRLDAGVEESSSVAVVGHRVAHGARYPVFRIPAAMPLTVIMNAVHTS